MDPRPCLARACKDAETCLHLDKSDCGGQGKVDAPKSYSSLELLRPSRHFEGDSHGSRLTQCPTVQTRFARRLLIACTLPAPHLTLVLAPPSLRWRRGGSIWPTDRAKPPSTRPCGRSTMDRWRPRLSSSSNSRPSPSGQQKRSSRESPIPLLP